MIEDLPEIAVTSDEAILGLPHGTLTRQIT